MFGCPRNRGNFRSDALVFRHGYVDYDNFWSSYEAMIKSGSTGHISSKEIIGVLTLESWMRSFERYLDLSPTSIEPGFATCSKAEKETPNVRMRVAQVTSAHLPNDNRIAYHIGATVAEAGYETTIVAPTPAGGMIGVEMPESVKLILLRRRNGRLARFTSLHLEILKIILQQRFEIIHIHDPDLLPLAIALKCAGKRVIYDAHECYRDDLDDKLWIPPFARGAARMAVIAVEWIASKTFDGVISASQDIHDKINPRWGAVVRNFPKMAADGNEALPGSYDERDCIVGYFGSIDELRYGEEMIEALALVRARCPTARMIVAGRITLPNPSKVKERLAALDIEYHTYLSRPRMISLIARCRVGLALYRQTRAYEKVEFSTKVLEYARVGTPVIAGPYPAVIKRFVVDNQIGNVVDAEHPATIAASIFDILDDRDRWVQYSKQSMAIARHYSWETESAKLIKLYDRISVEE